MTELLGTGGVPVPKGAGFFEQMGGFGRSLFAVGEKRCATETDDAEG